MTASDETRTTGRRPPSFRLRLTLHAVLISGLVLAVSGILIWHLVKQERQTALDRELSDLAYELLVVEHADPRRAGGGETRATVFGEGLHLVGVRVRDTRLDEDYTSPHWPADLQPLRLPAPLEARTYEPTGAHGDLAHEGRVRGESELEHVDDSEHEGRSVAEENEETGEDGTHHGRIAPQPRFLTLRLADGDWRVVGQRLDERTLFVAADLRAYQANLGRIGRAILGAMVLALALVAGGGWWLTGRALRPVEALTQAAEGITAADLARRLEHAGADREFARLIRVFNRMLERLERSFRQAARFSADASHELLTPLTVMQGDLEAELRSAPEGSELQRALNSRLEEVQRLKHMVRKLLLLSRADSGVLRPARQALDLSAVVQEVFQDASALDPGLRVECGVADGVMITGDPGLVRQMLGNLVANSVRHNRTGGWVRWRLTADGARAVLRAANSGRPIPQDLHERVFERFARVDPARSGEGAGLGLSLALEIARAHGGDLRLAASDDGGTVFELELPLRPGP